MSKDRNNIVRRCTTRVASLVSILLIAVGGFSATAGTAHATSGLLPIVCGGQKIAQQGHTWQTYPTGGYVGQGCGAGIDYIATPTGGITNSLYEFGTADGRTYDLYAWIPTVYATANMDFTINICTTELDTTVNEANVSGWVYIGAVAGSSGCNVSVDAWSGMVSSGHYLGLDAVKAVVS